MLFRMLAGVADIFNSSRQLDKIVKAAKMHLGSNTPSKDKFLGTSLPGYTIANQRNIVSRNTPKILTSFIDFLFSLLAHLNLYKLFINKVNE